MRILLPSLIFVTMALSACADSYPPTMRPDYTIRVAPSPTGHAATPPTCADWTADLANPYDNQPLPQFGCATARNLAMMVEQPKDLVAARDLGPANGTTAVGSMLRYNSNQTRGLLWTGQDPNVVAVTSASTPSSAISGEASASAGSSGGSGQAAASAP